MFEPIRGGTRGGQAEFKWSDVSADKDRENYLGHSINAPTGRWQKNKDVHWYNRDLKDSELQRLEEIRKVKEAEADALAVALGFTPEPKVAKPEPLGDDSEAKTSSEDPQRVIEKEERRRRKEEKRAKKEMKREMKEMKKDGKRGDRGHYYDRDDSRDSRPKLQRTRDSHSRSRSPHTRRRATPPPRDLKDYDDEQREKERQRDRRRWDLNTKRNAPGGAGDGSRWARGEDPGRERD